MMPLPSKPLLQILNPDLLAVAYDLWQLSRAHLLPPTSLYQVNSLDIGLELCRADGSDAIYTKRSRVRFLQDHVTAYRDQAWGEGILFSEYSCAPGIPVDHYCEGDRWYTLISLRESKSRGDVEDLYIRRRIKNGFPYDDEFFFAKIDHPTQHLTLSVIFPKERLPKKLFVTEQNAKRTQELSGEYVDVLPDKRLLARWEVEKPKRYETYVLRWQW